MQTYFLDAVYLLRALWPHNCFRFLKNSRYRFVTRAWHKIDRICLSVFNYTFEIMIFVSIAIVRSQGLAFAFLFRRPRVYVNIMLILTMNEVKAAALCKIWGNFLKNWCFVNTFAHMWHIIVMLPHTNQISFILYQISLT